MYLPSILPDEFLKGYMERATQCLGMDHSTDARLFLAEAYGLDANESIPLPVLIACVLSMDQTEVLRSHTLENLRNAFSEGDDFGCNAKWRRPDDYAGRSGVLFSAKLPGICHECARRDMEDYGCSYWHRLHLVEGIEYCPMHPDCRLFRVARKHAFKRAPHLHLKETPVGNENREPQNDRRTIGSLERRYLAACRLFLDQDRPVAAYKTVSKAIARTAATGSGSSNGRWESLSGQHPLVHAIEASMACETSKGWLASSFPGLTPATLNRFIRYLIDYRRSSTAACILACLHLGCWDTDVSLQGFQDWLNRLQ